jgi:hypothetical protein
VNPLLFVLMVLRNVHLPESDLQLLASVSFGA